jgi:hypothetical protein
MAGLRAVRAELEAALAGDENWRALRRTGAGGHGEPGVGRRDRDARLIKALEANPLYVAWTLVAKAIQALRDGDQAGGVAEPDDDLAHLRGIQPTVAALLAAGGVMQEGREVEAPWPEDAEQAEAIELPQVIRERIRADAAGDAPIERPTRQAAAAKMAEDAVEPSERSGERDADADELGEITEAPGKAGAEPLIEASVTSRKAAEPADKRLPAAAIARNDLASELPTLRFEGEPAEAKVTFVRRAAPELAAKGASGGEGDPQATPAGDAFVPAVAGADEAEVTIIKPEDPAVQRTRRFLKALSGD